MAHLVGMESNKALNEVGKIDGGYYITKNLWNKFLTTANMTEGQVKQFGSFMPGGFVASNTYYNMLLLYILVFVADGNVADLHEIPVDEVEQTSLVSAVVVHISLE